MPEAPPELGENQEPEKSTNKATRINWKKDNIIRDAKCVGFHILLTVEGVDKDNFGVEFVTLWNKVCEAQWGKRISLRDHIKKTQNRKAKVLDLYMRSMRGLETTHSNEDPRVNPAYKDNWDRLLKFLETGEYPPAPTYEEADIVPDDFEW